MVFAKGVANGFPLSGIVSNKDIMGTLDVGSMGGTYAGNAVACAAGVAAQEVFQSEDIGGNVVKRGKQLISALKGLQDGEGTKDLIADVRGIGVRYSFPIPSSSSKFTIWLTPYLR
jgi:4-aminobutyrate aminotransferase